MAHAGEKCGLVRWTVALAVVAAAVSSGCGAKNTIVPVSGRVTLRGKPVAKVGVTFTPVGGQQASPGPGSSGVTDAEGRFTLRTIGDKRSSGAVIGTHRVTLYLNDAGLSQLPYEEGLKKAAELNRTLPPKARDGSITFIVPPEGTTKADFSFE